MNNANSINTSNMNQNNQLPHQMGGPMMNMMSNNPSQMNMGQNQGPQMGMYGGPKPMPVSAGKVYPVDTPMVFNPQNPNAPPIYPCGVCHKEVHDNDQGLLCESGCNFWFHRYVRSFFCLSLKCFIHFFPLQNMQRPNRARLSAHPLRSLRRMVLRQVSVIKKYSYGEVQTIELNVSVKSHCDRRHRKTNVIRDEEEEKLSETFMKKL